MLPICSCQLIIKCPGKDFYAAPSELRGSMVKRKMRAWNVTGYWAVSESLGALTLG